MHNSKCRWCESENLAWSHETGFIVCMRCGAVLAPIMEATHNAQTDTLVRPLIRTSMGQAEEKIMEAARRGLLVRTTRRGLVLDHPGNRKARRVLMEMRELIPVYRALLEDPLLKSRTLRARVGLALYIHLILQGTPKGRALMIAAAKAGTSPYTIQSIIRRYRSRIDGVIARIRDAGSRSKRGGEEDTRAHLRRDHGEDKIAVPQGQRPQASG
ncbi:MAG: hypothetical protein F7C08_02655 [Desulfurococcales archaeon]|nr:hypothetical protein [Desulfurococcales archaeon]MCE4605418.1 hypothetical protein [Desulfurococcales archaeon]